MKLAIKYSKLCITVSFTEDVRLSKNKASAIRGGIGEMLLRENCIGDRKCENCEFVRECLVQRILYSPMDIEPKFMGNGDSVGYVIECEDYRRDFKRGDSLKFNIIVFGKVLVYFSQIIRAVFMLGVNGIGTYKAKYQIVSVDNTKGEHILEGSNVFMNRYLIETVGDYVKRRLGDIQGESNIYLKFATPVSLKYHGEFMQNFDIQTILNAIRRRLYILMCFEGIEEDNLYLKSDIIPEQISEHSIQSEVLRYSNRHRQGMKLKGITGELEIRKITGRNFELLIAGELIHIGNNTSFGFGKYEILLKE